MPHFRLRETNALDDRNSLECDKATEEEALLDFGQRLNVTLSLNEWGVWQYDLQKSDSYDNPRFGERAVPVYVVSDKR